MEKYSNFTTSNGKNVYRLDYIEKLREEEEKKMERKIPSNTFIAQKGAQETDLRLNVDILGTGGNRGGGKANPITTPVMTPTGWRKIGDLKIGDEICTPYDGIQEVSGIYPQGGPRRIYKVHFDDGTSVKCMENHRFYARTNPDEPFRELELSELFEYYNLNEKDGFALRSKSKGKLTEIPLCGEVEITDNDFIDLPIHPFAVGYAMQSGYISADTQKIPCSDRWVRRFFAACGYTIMKNKTGADFSYQIKGISKDRKKAAGLTNIGKIAVIPDIYMHANVRCRWDFIHGLFYQKGRSKRKHPQIDFQHRAFAEQVAEMLRSLGAWVRIVEVTDEPNHGGWWRLLIKLPNEKKVWERSNRTCSAQIWYDTPTEPPTTTTNEKTFIQGIGYWIEESYFTKKITWIEKILEQKESCVCITVTGRDHLYLTKDYVINHNTTTMLTKPLPSIWNKYFNGIIFRKNKKDFENIIQETAKWYQSLGRYNRSSDDMTWYFNTGAKLGLSYFDMSYQEFDDKYRGQQFAYIGIDEMPQMSFEMFKFLMTINRNTNGVRSQILFTCNPDPLSWLRKFLDWYIGKEDTIYSDGKKHPERKGLIIPERDGKIRYFYSPDNNVNNIVWGNTPHEVYLQCKDMIDSAWDDSLLKYGYTKETFAIKSFAFVKAELLDNKALIAKDVNYISALLNQPPEVRARELEGNWDVVRSGDDMIQAYHLDACFHNAQMLGDKVRRASCDVAGDGGDNCVTWLKIGEHVADVFVTRRDPYSTVQSIKSKLQEWGVLEQNFTFDLQGMGQIFKGAFPNAIPFNNQEAVDKEDKLLYDNKKSQCAYKFALKTQQAEWSIEPSLLDRMFLIGNTSMRLYDILQTERKAIRQDLNRQDKGWCLIHKEQMKNKAFVGHSPDFIEALMQFEIFNIKKKEAEIPSFLNGHIRHVRTFSFVN